jgi:hypothetical protein
VDHPDYQQLGKLDGNDFRMRGGFIVVVERVRLLKTVRKLFRKSAWPMLL